MDIQTNIYPCAVSHTAPHRPWSSIVTLSNAQEVHSGERHFDLNCEFDLIFKIAGYHTQYVLK